MKPMTIWERLDAERERLGLKKTEWAARVCDSKSSPAAVYNNWRDRGVPTDAYARIMQVTGWTYERLVEGATSNERDLQDPARAKSESDLAQAGALFSRLSEEGRTLALALLRVVESHSATPTKLHDNEPKPKARFIEKPHPPTPRKNGQRFAVPATKKRDRSS